jgi:hypothetical protein
MGVEVSYQMTSFERSENPGSTKTDRPKTS